MLSVSSAFVTSPFDIVITVLTAGVTKIETTLADGRQLIYYDDPGSTLPRERAIDARTLDPRPATATMRPSMGIASPFSPRG